MEEPIAIVGLDACMPGGDNPDAFFDFLCSGRSARSAVPSGRFNGEGFIAPSTSGGNEAARIVSTHGHFLEGSITAFDAPFFSITPAEAAGMDPQQRNFLETVYKALESAGITLRRAAGTRTGVYVGCSSADFRDVSLKDLDASLRYAGTGTINSMLSNRVSWFYDFTGPSMTIDTACSSSLVAVHQAVMALRNGSISMAIAGGTNLLLSPEMSISFSAMGVLSPDGISYSFDHRANGFSRGEGFAAIVLKRVSDALRDGDPIRAVIRNSSVNQDGHSPALTHSTRDSLLDLINTTYKGLDMTLTRFIEAHGTGTRVGDPIEAGALADAFATHRTAEEPLYVGAMKSSCGHLEGAAGLAAIVKTVLSLERGTIPGNTWFEKPNASISPDWHLAFPTESVPWPRTATGLRRASVNCFGLGGTNAHVVLDDALHFLQNHGLVGKHCTVEVPDHRFLANVGEKCPQATTGTSRHDDQTFPCSTPSTNTEGASQSESIEATSTPPSVTSGRIDGPSRSQLFIFTAHDQAGVSRLRQAYGKYLSALGPAHAKGSKPQFLHDLSFTLSAKRTQFPWRTAFVANSAQSLRMSLHGQDHAPAVRADDSRRLAFVFTGQGTQWPTMGMGLMVYPVFRRSMQKADAYLKSLGAHWSLIYELTKKSGMSRVDEAEFSQPLCTALQIALVDLVTSWKVTAGAVVGHSSGEIAAAYAAKAISAEDAWRLAYYRGSERGHAYFGGTGKLAAKLIKAQSNHRTGMAAVGLDHVDAMAAIQDLNRDHFRHPGHLEVACFNSRISHTVSGELDRIEALVANLNDVNVFAKKLKVEVAYHSQYVQSIADEYAKMIGDVGADSVPMDSSAPRFCSSTFGAAIDDSKLKSTAYWVDNMVSPVLFQQSLAEMLEDGPSHPITDVLEIGPHRGLRGPIGQISKDLGLNDFHYHFLMESGGDDISNVLSAAGTLFSRGISIDISLVNEQNKEHGSGGPNMLTNLPSYPFNHTKEYWSESRLSKAFAHRQYGRHEVLGTPVAHNSPHNSMWHHWLRLAEIPWLKDHQVGGSILFPAAGMLVMAVEAARQVAGSSGDIKGFRLRHVSFHAALHIPSNGTGVETYFYLQRVGQGAPEAYFREPKEFQLWSVSQGNEWLEHCRGTILVERKETATPVDGGLEDRELSSRCDSRIKQAIAACRTRIPSALMYQSFADGHLKFGETFQTLTDLYMDDPLAPRMTMANLRPDISYRAKETREGVMLHPTMVDGVLQAGLAPLLISRDAKRSGQPRVPVRIEEFWISAQSNLQDPIIPVQADVALIGRNEARSSCTATSKQTGKPLVLVKGLLWKTSAALSTNTDEHNHDPRHRAWNIDWKPDVASLSRDELESAFRPGKEPDQGVYAELDDCNELSARYLRRTLNLPDIRGPTLNRHVRTDSGIELPLEHAEPPKAASRSGHVQRYVELMKRLVAAQQQQYPDKASESIETLEARVASRATAHGKLVMAVGKELNNILEGTVDPLEILFGTTSLAEQFYLTGYGVERTSAQIVGYLDALAHKNPLIKILEVGAGTGGTARPVLDRLASRYRRYDFTDVSSAFLEKAKEKFADVARVDYRVLDVERNPSTQGFEAGTYDVLIATHVLHATRNVVVTLRNCLALLKPGGKLLLTENTRPATMMSNFVFGLFPGWWKSENEDRRNGPLLTAEAWERYALQSGFAGFDAVLPDYADEEHGLSAVLVCSAPDSTSKQSHGSELPDVGFQGNLVILADPVSDFQNGVVEDLKQITGNAVTGSPFTRVLPRALADMAREGHECNQDSTCIVLTELEAPTLANMSEASLVALKYVLRCKTVLWLAKAGAPELEVVQGFAAGVRLETPHMKLATISFDEPNLGTPNTIAEASWRVLDTILRKPTADADHTFRFADGYLHIPRLVEAKYLTDYVEAATKMPEVVEAEYGNDPERALRLQIKDPGLLDTIRFEEDPCSAAPLAANDVEVRTMASGVNFHDLSVMLGRIVETPLGLEGAGVVTRTGAQVTRFSPGDPVFGLAFAGTFQTRFRTKEGLLAHMPESLAFDEAASIPVVYTTAVACLFDIGGLDELHRSQSTNDESHRPSVLVHAAAGGVGQAAIQLAQREGAEIYATVGSLEKRDFLEKTYNIPRDHIFSSRDLTFRDGVLRMTNGRGVDIVLNSLSGDALRATWDCIAPFGRFAEIGLVDIHAKAGLSMEPFARNARFEAVSLEYMAQHAPRRLESLFQRAVRVVLGQPDGGVLARSTPLSVYPFSQVQAAMRHMQSGKHVGKLVLEPRSGDLVPVLSSSHQSGVCRRFDGNATYVVAGGLGGLGQAVVRWMIERGARYLLLLSRRGLPPADVDEMFDDVKGRYEAIMAPACDLTDLEVLRCVFQDCASTMPPILGCVQGGMVLKDMDFQDMTLQDWQASVQVKVTGSKNLWTALSETNGATRPLQFFIMLSSATSILGNPGQSNYIAGNTFQDAFARELAYQGHPAVSINIPMLSDVGFVAERPELMHHLHGAGWPCMWSRELLAALEYYCFHQNHSPSRPGLTRKDQVRRAQVAPRLWLPRLSQTSGQMASSWDKNPLLQPLKLWQHAEGGANRPGDDALENSAARTGSAKDRLASANTLKEAQEVVLEAFLSKLSRILSVGEAELSPARPLHAYGVDSLVAVELRSWFAQEVAADLTVLDMTSQSCIRQVAELAAARSASFSVGGRGS